MTKQVYLEIIKLLRISGKEVNYDVWQGIHDLLRILVANHYTRSGYEPKYVDGWTNEVVRVTKQYLAEGYATVFDDSMRLNSPEEIYDMFFTV